MEAAQLLERNLSVEVGLAGGVHDCHAATADLAQDLISPHGTHKTFTVSPGRAIDNR
jgi:hypothetical protein